MKLLLIDDDTFFLQFYQLKLKEKNFEVDVALDGEEGIKKIQEDSPDLILLDLIMPKKDGFAVLEFLSSNKKYKHIPVIVFSTLNQQSDIEKAKQLGATDYMDKSFFNFDGLLQKITAIKSKKE